MSEIKQIYDILHQVKTVFLSAKLHYAFARIVDTLVL